MVQERPVRVERRLSAILAADVAGYSRLMGLDEVGTAHTLREHRAVIDALVAKQRGRIVKTTGDGLLLEFPSVVDAVECALAVQTVMAKRNECVEQDRRMLLRIGINLGDILIEGDDILGDGINLLPDLRVSPNPVASASRLPFTIKFGVRSQLSLLIWANRASRILPAQSRPMPWSGIG